jgi:hypothetical protein
MPFSGAQRDTDKYIGRTINPGFVIKGICAGLSHLRAGKAVGY